MNKLYIILLVFISIQLNAQERYLDAEFEVAVEKDKIYGNNISILTGMPAPLDLTFDVYTPKDDTETNRPAILVAHTGSFLPPLFNGGITGSKGDSSVVNICRQLASRGYVAVAFTYRAGWLPTSPDQNVRTGTLLQAAYRGIQDARSCVRHLRETVDVGGNLYGIDPDKIGMVGVGTGSYLAYGCGSVYDFEEVLLEKFINTETALPYIDSLILGNIYGDTQAALCSPNTPGYSSEIDFAFSLGGALGDATWIDGEEREAAFSGIHCTQDIFAPYGDGPVIVPTTNEFVVNVSGNRTAIQRANELGNNDVLNDPSVAFALQENVEVQKTTNVMPALSAPINMGEDHFYGFNLPFPQGSPYAFWDFPTLQAVVAGTNAALGTDFNADTLHLNGLATNPDMSPEKGKAYLDTIITFMTPRACLALNLNCNLPTNTVEIPAASVELQLFPNPAVTSFTINVADDVTINKVYIYSMDGRMVKALAKINANQVTMNSEGLNSGMYAAQIVTEKGTVVKELVIK